MITSFFLYIIAFFVALLPVYLWGYWVSKLLDTPWNRRRFLLGMFIGGFSVLVVWFFSYITIVQHIYLLAASIGFIFIMGLIIFSLIYTGSAFAKWVLHKVAIANIVTILLLLMLISYGSVYISGGTVILLSIFSLLISSLIEESSKHLMSIGLMSQDFRFSRSDIIIFTIFVVLGFIFIENLLYLIQGDSSLLNWIFRSFFSLTAHLLSAVICAYAWWRALTYEPFSWQYIILFSSGFIVAVMTHLGYNMILEQSNILWLFIYMIVGYIVITRGILIETTKTFE